MRPAFVIAALLLTTACASTDDGIRVIDSEPRGALVQIEGHSDCHTPCTISVDYPVDVIIAKAGFLPDRFRMEPGTKDIFIRLDLAAPTNDVDTVTLPEIN